MMIRAPVVAKLYEDAAKEKGAWRTPGSNNYIVMPLAEVFHRAIVPFNAGTEGQIRGARESGDYHFCTKALAAGFEVWIDPQLMFGHVGDKVWQGSLIRSHLTATGGWKTIVQKRLQAIDFANDDARNNAFMVIAKTMADAYGNQPWACGPSLTAILMALACDADVKAILETGSGLTTAALQAVVNLRSGKRLMSLEAELSWKARTEQFLLDLGIDGRPVTYARIVEGDGGPWYDVSLGFVPDLLFIDGPKRDKAGMRGRVLDRLPRDRKPPKYVVVDDVDDQDGLTVLQRLGGMGYTVDSMEEPGRRTFAVCEYVGVENLMGNVVPLKRG